MNNRSSRTHVSNFFSSNIGSIFIRSVERSAIITAFILVIVLLGDISVSIPDLLVAVPPIVFGMTFTLDVIDYIHKLRFAVDRRLVDDTLARIDHHLQSNKLNYRSVVNNAQNAFALVNADGFVKKAELVISELKWKDHLMNEKLLKSLFRRLMYKNKRRDKALHVFTTTSDTLFSMIGVTTAIFGFYLIKLVASDTKKNDDVIIILSVITGLIALLVATKNVARSKKQYYFMTEERLVLDANIDYLFFKLSHKNRAKLPRDIVTLLDAWHANFADAENPRRRQAAISDFTTFKNADFGTTVYNTSQFGTIFAHDLTRGGAAVVGFILITRIIFGLRIANGDIPVIIPPSVFALILALHSAGQKLYDNFKKEQQIVAKTLNAVERSLMENSGTVYGQAKHNVREIASGQAPTHVVMYDWKTLLQDPEVLYTLKSQIQNKHNRSHKIVVVGAVFADMILSMLGATTAVLAYYLLDLVLKDKRRDNVVFIPLLVAAILIGVYAGINNVYQSVRNIKLARKEQEELQQKIDHIGSEVSKKDTSELSPSALSVLNMWANSRRAASQCNNNARNLVIAPRSGL